MSGIAGQGGVVMCGVAMGPVLQSQRPREEAEDSAGWNRPMSVYWV